MTLIEQSTWARMMATWAAHAVACACPSLRTMRPLAPSGIPPCGGFTAPSTSAAPGYPMHPGPPTHRSWPPEPKPGRRAALAVPHRQHATALVREWTAGVRRFARTGASEAGGPVFQWTAGFRSIECLGVQREGATRRAVPRAGWGGGGKRQLWSASGSLVLTSCGWVSGVLGATAEQWSTTGGCAFSLHGPGNTSAVVTPISDDYRPAPRAPLVCHCSVRAGQAKCSELWRRRRVHGACCPMGLDERRREHAVGEALEMSKDGVKSRDI